MYLLDTSFVVNFLRQKQNAVSVMQDISDEQLFLSVIVNVEMFRGFYFTANTQSMQEYREFIQNFTVLEVTTPVIDVFSRVWSFLRHKNQSVADFDLLIAATCLTHSLTLVTYNVDHFKRIPGLKIREVC